MNPRSNKEVTQEYLQDEKGCQKTYEFIVLTASTVHHSHYRLAQVELAHKVTQLSLYILRY